jgi:outer membrane lipoprotein SlyB
MKVKVMILLFVLPIAAGGCATVPRGPSVKVLPGSGKTFEQFQADDAMCRQWADQHTAKSPQEVASQNTVTGAAVGTAAGALLGAVIGSASGHAGTGAAIGAGSGLLLGTSAGASSGQEYVMESQRRYDIAYQQCMYAKGNQIPSMEPGPPAPVAQAAPPPPPPPPVVVSSPPPQIVLNAPPRFIYTPALGFYVAVETPYDLVFLDGRYYRWSNGFWYTAPYYYGPWMMVEARRLPRALRRARYEEIRRHRDLEYHAFLHDRKHYHGRWHVPDGRPEHR